MTGTTSSKPIAVTGIGILTSLGEGKAENWRRLSAGESGIHRLTRFPIDNMRTTIGGSVDFLPVDPLDNSNFSFEMARRAAREAIEESGIGPVGHFPGEMFLAAPPIDLEWSRRMSAAGTAPSCFCRESAGVQPSESYPASSLYAKDV